ncbi:hypothetical protein D3C71_2163560 [compost metagenome]
MARVKHAKGLGIAAAVTPQQGGVVIREDRVHVIPSALGMGREFADKNLRCYYQS